VTSGVCLQMAVDDASLFELEAAVRAICKTKTLNMK
jgi:hypothetical protein